LNRGSRTSERFAGGGKATVNQLGETLLHGRQQATEATALLLQCAPRSDANERSNRLNELAWAIASAIFQNQLSGGQQQRVAVARALVGSPSILLADEPTGNLDSRNGEAVMELLSDLRQGGATICMVTHDDRFVRSAERTIQLFDGRIVEEA
jgi:ABC-type lipoprotein export system ATPase subunit